MESDPTPTFVPPRWLRGGHAQTMWSSWAPRGRAGAVLAAASRAEIIPSGSDRLRLHRGPRPGPDAPVLIVLHGLTGCAGSPNVLGLAAKAHARGFETVRLDLRNATGDCPSRQIGHAGRSEDLVAVLDHITSGRPASPIAVAGFSLGGNVALKALGELGAAAPTALSAAAVISVPLDLDRATRRIDARDNWSYRRYFLRRLAATLRRRADADPDRYAGVRVPDSWSIRDFDDAIVAPLCGFRDAADYYARSSSLALLPEIRVPTLLIQATDDPFVPFETYRDRRVGGNPAVRLLATSRGGHVGFWAAGAGPDADRFWAEARAVDFLAARTGLLRAATSARCA